MFSMSLAPSRVHTLGGSAPALLGVYRRLNVSSVPLICRWLMTENKTMSDRHWAPFSNNTICVSCSTRQTLTKPLCFTHPEDEFLNISDMMSTDLTYHTHNKSSACAINVRIVTLIRSNQYLTPDTNTCTISCMSKSFYYTTSDWIKTCFSMSW